MRDVIERSMAALRRWYGEHLPKSRRLGLGSFLSFCDEIGMRSEKTLMKVLDFRTNSLGLSVHHLILE